MMYKLIVAFLFSTLLTEMFLAGNLRVAQHPPSEFLQFLVAKETVVEGSPDPSPRRGDSRRES